MRQTYTSIIFQHDVDKDGPAQEFSIVAVRDGVAIACMYKQMDTAGGMPAVLVPDYVTFTSLFESDVTLVKHPPVQVGTEWDGEKFIIPDDSDFITIGRIGGEVEE